MNRRPFMRCDRVAAELKKVISDIIYRNVSDPRLKNVTVTEVILSKDLRIARVYFAFHESGKRTEEDVLQGFVDAKGYIKREVTRKMKLRYMPNVSFFYDRSIDYGTHMNKVLESLVRRNII